MGIMARESGKVAAQANLKLVSRDDGDKQRALEAAIAQIDRAFGKGSVMKLGKNGVTEAIPSVSTGSLGLDMALGIGGLPRGRVIEVFGPESSGKTTLALHTVAAGTGHPLAAERQPQGPPHGIGRHVEQSGLGRIDPDGKLDLASQAALDHLAKHAKDKKVGLENILWALLNTKEFMFNH